MSLALHLVFKIYFVCAYRVRDVRCLPLLYSTLNILKYVFMYVCGAAHAMGYCGGQLSGLVSFLPLHETQETQALNSGYCWPSSQLYLGLTDSARLAQSDSSKLTWIISK